MGPALVPIDIGTRGPFGRYGAALFIEREGFSALFEAVSLITTTTTSLGSQKRRVLQRIPKCTLSDMADSTI